jgi:hypothetical protein
MYKQNLLVLAIFIASSQAHQLNKKSKFAKGYARMEKMGETIKIKGDKLKEYHYLETEDGIPTWAVRGEKNFQGWAQDHVDWEDSQADKANGRIPYASTIQLGWENDTPSVRGQKQWDNYEHKNVANPNTGTRAPYHSSNTQLISLEDTANRLAYYIQLDDTDDVLGTTTDPSGVRGEKRWQTWAQALVDHEDSSMNTANTRIPYSSTLQLEDTDDVIGDTTDPTGVRGEKRW